MKPYGHYKFDKFSCPWGCCQQKGCKKLHMRKVYDRACKKRARRFKCEAEE